MVAGMEASAKARFGDAKAAYEGLEILLSGKNNITEGLQSPNLNMRDVKYANND
jgi:hypothetical protein